MYKIFRDVCFNNKSKSNVIKKDDFASIANTDSETNKKPREWLSIENYPSQADLHAVWIAIDKMYADISIAKDEANRKPAKRKIAN